MSGRRKPKDFVGLPEPDQQTVPGVVVGAATYAGPVSMPSIPGFTTPPARNTLADQWKKPNVEFPAGLWPIDFLQSVTTQPNEWLTIEQFTQDEGGTDGRGCVLVTPHQT